MTFDYNIEQENGTVMPLEITYDVSGSYSPARLNCLPEDATPEEFPEIDDIKARNPDTGVEIELTQAEYDIVSIKCEEHLAETEDAEEADRGCALYHEMRGMQGEDW